MTTSVKIFCCLTSDLTTAADENTDMLLPSDALYCVPVW